MKKHILFLIAILFLAIWASAQTQQGYVKTKGRLANDGSVIAGTRIPNTTIQVKGRTPVVSQANGTFSFPIPDKKFYLNNVQKKGYVLTDPEVLSKQYSYSTNDLIIVMEDLAQQEADRRAIERKISSKLYAQLMQRGEELEVLKEENKITEEKYRELMQKLNHDQDESERIIKEMAEHYTKMDFDQINESNRKISEFILNCELNKADSMLRIKGDIHARINDLNTQHNAIIQAKQTLDANEAKERKDRNEIAEDCYHLFEIFEMQHLNDSAAYYIELRAGLDTTLIGWQLEAGQFLSSSLTEYERANSYYARSLRLAQAQYESQSLDMISVYNYLIRFYQSTGQYDESMVYCNKVSQLLDLHEESCNPIIQKSYENMGIIYDELGYSQQALQCYRKSLELSLLLYGEEDHTTATAYYNLGAYYYLMDEYEHALESLDKSMGIYRTIGDSLNECMASNYEAVAMIYKNNGAFGKAVEFLDKSIELNILLFGENHPNVANCYFNLAGLLLEQNQFNDALQYFDTAKSILTSTIGKLHPIVAGCYNSIGIIFNKLGDYEQATANLNEALDIFRILFDENNSHIGNVYVNLGQVRFNENRFEEAAMLHKKSLDIFLSAFGENHHRTSTSYNNLASDYLNMGEYELALKYAQMALKIDKTISLGEDSPNLAYDYNTIASIYNKMEQYDRSIEYLEQSKKIVSLVYGEEHPNVAYIYYNIGFLHKKQNNLPKAIEYTRRALEMLLNYFPEDHPTILQIKENLEEMKKGNER